MRYFEVFLSFLPQVADLAMDVSLNINTPIIFSSVWMLKVGAEQGQGKRILEGMTHVDLQFLQVSMLTKGPFIYEAQKFFGYELKNFLAKDEKFFGYQLNF